MCVLGGVGEGRGMVVWSHMSPYLHIESHINMHTCARMRTFHRHADT